MNLINRPFVGIPTFLRSGLCQDIASLNAPIAVMGFPFDEGSPFMPGSRFGPRALREHSLRFTAASEGYFDPESDQEFLDVECRSNMIIDVGDVDVAPTHTELTFENATSRVRALTQTGAMVVVLGGDHSITYPVVRGFTEPLHLIHFDAHLDYEPFTHGMRHTNAHSFRHIRKMEHVESLIQVGIRSLRHSREVMRDARRDGNRIITMSQFRANSAQAIASMVPRDASCYVSIDVDVLDISLVPGCVSAEPNGMLYHELRDALKAIAAHCRVVGFDLVEVNPLLDVATGATCYLATHTVIEFLGHVCAQPRWATYRARWLR